MDLELVNKEQIRRMILYRKRLSEKLGYDVGEKACLEWIEKYSGKFREWADKIPEDILAGLTGMISEDFKEDLEDY